MHTQFLHWILWKIFERPGWEGMAWYGTVWHGTTWSMVCRVSKTALILCRFHATSLPVNVANDFLINRHWVWGFLSSTATAAAKCVATCDRQLQRLPQQQLARSSWGWVEVDWFKNASHVYIFIYRKVLTPQAKTCERSAIDIRHVGTDKLTGWQALAMERERLKTADLELRIGIYMGQQEKTVDLELSIEIPA